MNSTQFVLDASALLAFLQNEPGAARIKSIIDQAALSSVNLSEVVQKSLARGVDTVGMREEIEAMGVTFYPFTAEDAKASANLWAATRPLGLSLADRACLALARRLNIPAMTGDRVWAQLDIGVQIEVFR